MSASVILQSPGPDSSAGPLRERPAGDPLQVLLSDIWVELLGAPPPGIDHGFVALAGDRTLVPRLRARIRQSCGLAREPEWITGEETIDELSAVLVRGAESGTDRHFPGRDGVATLFLCDGDLNGGGYYTVELARRLFDSASLHVLAPPRLNDEPLRDDIESLAASCLSRIRVRQPAGPYRIAGYCNGALVAYEVARQLVEQGERVERLILVDPTLRNSAFWFLGRPLRAFARCIGVPVRRRLRAVRVVRDAGWELLEWWARFRPVRKLKRLLSILQLRESGGAANAVRPASRPPRRALSEAAIARQRARRRDYDEIVTAVRGYIPGRYRGHIDAIWSTDQLADPSYASVTAWPRVAPDTTVTVMPGNHQTCLATYVDALAEAIRAALRSRERRASR